MQSRPYLIPVTLIVLLALLPFVSTTAIAQDNSLAAPTLNLQVDGTTVTLSWGAVQDAARYELWQWDDVNKWVRLDNGNLTETSFTKSGLREGTQYYYAVRAISSTGQTSDWSEYTSVTIRESTSPAPTNTPYPTYTPYPTATVYSTPTPLPVESTEPCWVIEQLSLFEFKLQTRTIKAFVDNFGESPKAYNVHWAIFVPEDGTMEVAYRIRTSEDRYVLVWEYWKGCQFNGGVMYYSDIYGNRLD